MTGIPEVKLGMKQRPIDEFLILPKSIKCCSHHAIQGTHANNFTSSAWQCWLSSKLSSDADMSA